MTPATLLVGFCAAMAAVAVGRLATDERRDYVDVGAALVVVGCTLLSASWAALETGALPVAGQVLLAVGGAGVGCGGVVLMVRYWDASPASVASDG